METEISFTKTGSFSEEIQNEKNGKCRCLKALGFLKIQKGVNAIKRRCLNNTGLPRMWLSGR